MSPAVAYPGDEARQVIVSVNPKAGARSGRPLVDALAASLVERGMVVEVVSDAAKLATLAEQTHQAGELRAVVAAGGDGTAAFVTNCVSRGTPITVLPLGTENLLAKYLGLAGGPESVAETIQRGVTVRLDAGRADGRLFILMLSCGFDADVIRRLHEERRGHIQHLSYAKPIFQSIRNYHYPEIRLQLSVDGGEPESTQICGHWAFVFNIPAYATGLMFTPEAVATDGLLDVCTFQGGSIWHGLFYLSQVILGQHKSWNQCVTARSATLRIESDAEQGGAVVDASF